ncbi:hypothetical protein [Natranaerofaba carboxydovora]|uniref:hypothetical protein n=1 Tax=Natranaerofaba carboxydovora TaxID=2742683 RepID=UPI001F131BC3|nr:hypothetical protein [Natranaerofaba carboxydovora]UMZ72702.1 hypothetical protein ACONDI_00228 [Natranaerofaba carboxydovora]
MISEIKGKVGLKGKNLSERSEDKLTGDVFGSLRYIPFDKAMKIILNEACIKKEYDETNWLLNSLNFDYWNDNIHFWPKHSLGELDLLLTFENLIIGVEVKYLSGLSSEDDIANEPEINVKENSINQLAIETRILNNICNNKETPLLLFVAPEPFSYSTVQEVIDRNILEHGVSVGYLSWEIFYEKIKELINDNNLNDFEKLILNDIQQLLQRRGLERFRDFKIGLDKVEAGEHFCFKGKVDDETTLNFDFNLGETVLKGGAYEFESKY